MPLYLVRELLLSQQKNKDRFAARINNQDLKINFPTIKKYSAKIC